MNNNHNNGYREVNSCCYFHPKELVVGVCHLCLHERLVIIAAKQGGHHHHQRHQDHRKTPINIPKIFALGSLLNKLEFRHNKKHSDKSDVSTSPEDDSFISIKFEDNGAASWEKSNTISKVCQEKQYDNKSCNNQNYKNKLEAKQGNIIEMNKETMSMIEHAKPRGGAMRWRKRIGHLFQIIKLKRSNKGNMSHVDGVKMRKKGWIRNLTNRRNKE